MHLHQVYGIAGSSRITVETCVSSKMRPPFRWWSLQQRLVCWFVLWMISANITQQKIKVPTWNVSMDAMYCHGITKTAGCEKVLPQTSIWISSSVLSKAPAHLREYTCTGCLVHSIDSAQQSVCQPSVSRSCFGIVTRLTQTGGVL